MEGTCDRWGAEVDKPQRSCCKVHEGKMIVELLGIISASLLCIWDKGPDVLDELTSRVGLMGVCLWAFLPPPNSGQTLIHSNTADPCIISLICLSTTLLHFDYPLHGPLFESFASIWFKRLRQ